MIDRVFLDTVGPIALLSRDDGYHSLAREVFAVIGEAGGSVYTTDLVLAEFGNGLARTTLRQDVIWLIQQLHDDPTSTVLYTGQSELFDAISLYGSRSDKQWGLVDCVSFCAMRANAIESAFTADRHFEQAGFRCLLSPKDRA